MVYLEVLITESSGTTQEAICRRLVDVFTIKFGIPSRFAVLSLAGGRSVKQIEQILQKNIVYLGN